MRDGGWEEYSSSGVLNRVYAGLVGLGAVSTGSQVYYQASISDAPANFTFTDQANEGIQVFGDASNGNFDKRVFFKAFVREQGKSFSDSVLADTGKTTTGANIVNVLLSNADDSKISDLDAEMTNAPYNNINVEYFGSNQSRTIGGVAYNYNVIIAGNGATLEQIYTKMQYLLRQGVDIDNGAGTVTGKTADLLCGFVGDTLETTMGVFVDNIQSADSNRINFKDVTGTFRVNPFTAAGTLNFNAVMVGAGSSYRLLYSAPAGTGNDYGEAGAITVVDASSAAITGTIGSSSIDFDFDYDGDTAGGTAATDKAVTLIGIRKNSSKFAVATGTISKSKGLSFSLVAETDRAYV
jgi:hypothetical protein